MKSEDMTFWQIVKHVFGFHTWSEWKHVLGDDVYYRNCEICGVEQSESGEVQIT